MPGEPHMHSWRAVTVFMSGALGAWACRALIRLLRLTRDWQEDPVLLDEMPVSEEPDPAQLDRRPLPRARKNRREARACGGRLRAR